jgi:hypothetical protein
MRSGETERTYPGGLSEGRSRMTHDGVRKSGPTTNDDATVSCLIGARAVAGVTTCSM